MIRDIAIRRTIRGYVLKYRFMLYDIVNGLHSSMPICCISSYSILGRSAMYWSDLGHVTPNHIQYVQCARCRRSSHSIAIKHNGVIASWILPPRAFRPWQGD